MAMSKTTQRLATKKTSQVWVDTIVSGPAATASVRNGGSRAMTGNMRRTEVVNWECRLYWSSSLSFRGQLEMNLRGK